MLALAEFIARRYSGKVVEVGIGSYVKVAEELVKRGLDVYATDVVVRKVPRGVRFFLDDVTSPKMEIYEGASLVYSIRPPPELYSAIARVAELVGADCIIKPLHEVPRGRLLNYRGVSFYLIERH
ncbi:MAG: UPF0146 family protein [Archaeoglobaceae archaeon]